MAMIYDAHMHSSFSGDGRASMDEMARAAVRMGLPGICLTDHLDLDYPEDPDLFLLDLPRYAAAAADLRAKFAARGGIAGADGGAAGETPGAGSLDEGERASRGTEHGGCGMPRAGKCNGKCAPALDVLFGLELGLQPHLAARHEEILSSYPFDFVIGSSHVVHGQDPYYASFYEGRPQEAGYREYFESILENIRAFDGFDVYGHLDYVVRYGPSRNEGYSYEKYADVIDAILSLLIEKGKGIELNTGGFKYGLGHPNPTERIISRYRELGGEIITVGSDAHAPEHVGYDFAKAIKILREAGFVHYAVFCQRKPRFLPLP